MLVFFTLRVKRKRRRNIKKKNIIPFSMKNLIKIKISLRKMFRVCRKKKSLFLFFSYAQSQTGKNGKNQNFFKILKHSIKISYPKICQNLYTRGKDGLKLNRI